MTYKEFHDRLIKMLNEEQITVIQEIAFQNYEDAHGHRPRQKTEKMISYGFIIDFLRDLEVTECVGYLKPFGIPIHDVIKLWDGLE